MSEDIEMCYNSFIATGFASTSTFKPFRLTSPLNKKTKLDQSRIYNQPKM